MAAAFSRLQLAAALIEYDNDDSDPSAPRLSAHDSAIFAHLRQNVPPRPRRSTDYLGVSLPSETGSVAGRESVLNGRESALGGRESVMSGRRSIDALRNPFARDSTFEGHLEEDEEEEMEVDLASWGLDALVQKDKDNKNHRKAKSGYFPNPHDGPNTDRPSGLRSEPGRRAIPTHRTMSLGNLDNFGEGGVFLDAPSDAPPSLSTRRHSIGTALDFTTAKSPVEQRAPRGRVASSHALIENLPVTPPLHSIPFPTSESTRSPSPLPFDGTARLPSRGAESALDRGQHARIHSAGTMGLQMLLNEERSNPFALRPPSPDRASRFDPKTRARTTSHGSLGTMLSPEIDDGEEHNPFALRPPSPSRSSRFDPKVRPRTISNGSLGTQMMLDNDARSAYGAHEASRPYSRLELMRPKMLIMPSPLQAAVSSGPQSVQTRATEGFELHPSDWAPLPPGARSTRATSMYGPSPGLVASNSFTPNPRATMSLAQLTFRNTLMVDGMRDPAYSDVEDKLRRATEEGEQAEWPEPETPVALTPASVIVTDPADRSKRPAGKLYGRSLIEDIEARKSQMRQKQRVFTGDDRPSMMARTQIRRSSTLIDPTTLPQRPQSQRMDSFRSQPESTRRLSGNAGPLLNIDNGNSGAPQRPGMMNAKSVFGVDTLWERELVKLRQMEEQERLEGEEEARRDAEEEAKLGKKGKGKKKGKKKDKKAMLEAPSPAMSSTMSDVSPDLASNQPHAPSPSFVLPDIEHTTGRRRRLPPPAQDNRSEECDPEDPVRRRRTVAGDAQAEEWAAGSSDEEKEARRRTITGPRIVSTQDNAPRLVLPRDDDSDEDVPLGATIGRASRRMTRSMGPEEEDSDEEKPLVTLLDKKMKLPSMEDLGGSLFPGSASRNDDEEEDDKPLGLRASRVLSSGMQDDEDDRPLAFHPEQVRKSQFMMLAQQQQQQMMMQAHAAQFHQSMIFGTPSMMASGFFGPPIPPPMVIIPPVAGSPPPIHEEAKLGRVDKWRHEVAVEGQQ